MCNPQKGEDYESVLKCVLFVFVLIWKYKLQNGFKTQLIQSTYIFKYKTASSLLISISEIKEQCLTNV